MCLVCAVWWGEAPAGPLTKNMQTPNATHTPGPQHSSNKLFLTSPRTSIITHALSLLHRPTLTFLKEVLASS